MVPVGQIRKKNESVEFENWRVQKGKFTEWRSRLVFSHITNERVCLQLNPPPPPPPQMHVSQLR